MNEIDRKVRAAVYTHFIEQRSAPNAASIAFAAGLTSSDAASALRRLDEEHRVVLAGDGRTVLMAHPFAGTATGYTARIGKRVWQANCGWDAFAILAMLGDGDAAAVSPVDGTTSRWSVTGGEVIGPGLIHFVVPARSFWDDIGFT